MPDSTESTSELQDDDSTGPQMAWPAKWRAPCRRAQRSASEAAGGIAGECKADLSNSQDVDSMLMCQSNSNCDAVMMGPPC